MAGLLERLRARIQSGSAAADAPWDDHGVEDVAASLTAIAATWDPEPGDSRVTAGRAAVLGAFADATAPSEPNLQGASGRPLPPAGAAPGVRRGGRRPALVLVVAGLLLAASVGAVAASAPGGPLYDTRIASEAALLPAAPARRAAAQVERLEARVAEATGAAARGDEGGLQAALGAYARIAAETASGPPPEPAAATPLAARVRTQLEVIAGFGGDPAIVAAREQARIAARALLGRLGEPIDGGGPGPSGPAAPSTGGPPPASPGGGGSPPGTGGPPASADPGASKTPGGAQGSPAPAGSGGPPASSGPRATASPRSTPAPTPHPTPAPTPRTTARPSPTSGGGSGSGSPGGGASPTPAPGGGPGQGGSGSGASPSPGGRP